MMNDLAPKSRNLLWIWLILTIGLGGLTMYLFYQTLGTTVPASWGVDSGVRQGWDQWLNAIQQFFVSPVLLSTFGVLILSRHPRHRVGSLLIVLGMITVIAALAQEWAVYGYYTRQDDSFYVTVSAWVTNWIWILLFGVLLLIAAVFPSGEFLSRRWSRLILVPLSFFLVPTLLGAMVETPMTSAFQIANPFVEFNPDWFYNVVFILGIGSMVVTSILVLVEAVRRFRHSRGRERQQMKWLLYGVVVMVFLTVMGIGIYFFAENNFGAIMVNAAMVGPTIGIGVALLRHRLYDVDILIRRTIQYTLLTGVLAIFYFGGVVFLQAGLRIITGRGESPLVTVITTLGIAALFNPLRHRIQEFIDRRFYRSKYDAQLTLAHFAETARDEVDIAKLNAELLAVIQETMQPENVSLWVRATDPVNEF